jgi:hypothetical protein
MRGKGGGRECLDRCTYTVEEWMGRGNMILHYSLLFTFQNSSVCVVTVAVSISPFLVLGKVRMLVGIDTEEAFLLADGWMGDSSDEEKGEERGGGFEEL